MSFQNEGKLECLCFELECEFKTEHVVHKIKTHFHKKVKSVWELQEPFSRLPKSIIMGLVPKTRHHEPN